MLLDVGNDDILDSGIGSIGGVAMGVWCKLVFLGGRGGVVPAALVRFAIVSVASSPVAALGSSSVASASPVVRGSSSVVAVVAHVGKFNLAVAVVCSVDQTILFWIPALQISVVVGSMST
jgi:hypothetical protein